MLTSLYFFLYFRPKGAIEFIGIDFFEFNKGIFFDFFFEISCGKKVVIFPVLFISPGQGARWLKWKKSGVFSDSVMREPRWFFHFLRVPKQR
jgi:hypothetical protein